MEAGHAGILGIVQNRRDGRRAAFFGRAGGLHRVGEQAVANISRRGIHFETGANGFRTGSVVAHELNEAVGDFFPHAAVDELLFCPAEFGEFGEDASAAERGEQVGGVADGGIRGEAGKAVGAAAFQAESELRKRRGLAFRFVGFDKTEEGFANGLRKHCRFGSAFLLFENQNRFAAIRVAALDLLEEDGNLRVLATEAKNRGASNVGMMNVACEQATEIVRVFASAAAAAFVHKKFDSVDVAKEFRRRRSRLHRVEGESL